jgi:hypothetical protein
MLIDGLRRQGSVGQQVELFLQRRQSQPLSLMGLLHPAQHRFVTSQPAARMQGLHHEARRRVTITTVPQLLPQLPPWLIRKQFPLIAAVWGCPDSMDRSLSRLLNR